MLERVLNWWRDKSGKVDFFILLTVCVAGFLRWPMVLIAFAAGLLAASPVWKYITMVREHPKVDARHVVRELTIEVVGYAVMASIGAYLVGAGVAWVVGVA